jgi:hypothetical protein
MEVKIPIPQHPVELLSEKYEEKNRTKKELETLLEELWNKFEEAHKKLQNEEYTMTAYEISFEQQERIGCGPNGMIVLSEKMGKYWSLPYFKERTEKYLKQVKESHKPEEPIKGHAYIEAYRDHGHETVQAKDPRELI